MINVPLDPAKEPPPPDTAQALSELAERLHLASEAAGIGTWEWSLAPLHIHWDAQMFRLYGVPGGPVTPQRWQQLLHPEDAARVQRDVQMVIGEQLNVIDHQYRIVRPDGEVRHVHSVGRAIARPDGRRRMVGINLDVTDRERSTQAQLERDAAERASRAKSEFLSRVSHELRTPLNGILGFAQLLQQREAELPGWAARPLRQIRQAGDHLLALIDDMLDLAAIEAGRMRLSPEPVSLGEVAHEAVALTQPFADERGVRVVGLVEAGAPLLVQCDRTRLMQVLLNLLSNAVKFNRPGGDVRLAARADRAAGTVQVDIADSGVGLSVEQQRALYQPFNRLGAESRGVPGAGLGLTLSRQLAEAMGGRLAVRSAPGVGTCVTLELALAAGGAPASPIQQAVEAARQAMAEPCGAASTSVLYVEDNPINVLLVREALGLHGGRFELHVATDGEEGLRLLETLRPHLVLLDINLPGMSGHDVLRRLRADPRFAALPCVAVSADAMPDEIARAREHGFDDYWTKPLDIARLAERITRAAASRPAPAA